MAFDYVSIGLRIKHARNKKGMTQEKLAETLGLTREQISRTESGLRGISLEVLVSISNTLEVPISELLADNLSSPQDVSDSELHYILLDCTQQEEKIITKTAQALKAILNQYGV